MPQSLSSVYIHLVFSTLDRKAFLKDVELRKETHRYLGGVSNGKGCLPILIGGVEDHVHILSSLSRTVSQADYVKILKTSSNGWLREKGLKDFAWQSGYGAFSVSKELLPAAYKYVENQEDHHKKFDFKAEFRALLAEHDILWDERYVWD